MTTAVMRDDKVRDDTLKPFDPTGWNGAWRRLGWNFCWREGMREPYPHSPEFMDGLPERMREYLLARGAPQGEAAKVAEWASPRYAESREWREGVTERILNDPSRFCRPFHPVPRLPELMRRPDGRGGSRDLVQFSKDWATQPADRMTMMADPPPDGTEMGIACSIAAVVHALCDLDEMTPPDWVYQFRAPETMLVWGMQDFDAPRVRKRIIAKSPPACEYHRVYFDRSFIEGPLWINTPKRDATPVSR